MKPRVTKNPNSWALLTVFRQFLKKSRFTEEWPLEAFPALMANAFNLEKGSFPQAYCSSKSMGFKLVAG